MLNNRLKTPLFETKSTVFKNLLLANLKLSQKPSHYQILKNVPVWTFEKIKMRARTQKLRIDFKRFVFSPNPPIFSARNGDNLAKFGRLRHSG
jgi:hypothetical protein